MTSLLLVLAPLAPVTLAGALLVPRLAATALAAAPWAALPALALALLGGDGANVSFSDLLLGAELALDDTGRAFLLAASVLWLASGVYARSALRESLHVRRFTGCWLLASAGNFSLVVASDAATFALGFAVMTFSAYVLVVHDGTRRAFRAGRFYVALAVVAEALLLGGMLLGISAAGSFLLADIPAGIAGDPRSGIAVGLLLAGFGIKAGIVPLHFWLPLAHPVAPTPASAVLSGAMISAGVLGWLRFLPLEEAQLPGWAAACVIIGLATAFYGVAVGVTQPDAKTNLAYSSVSQLGLALVAVGAGLARLEAAAPAAGAATFQAVQHGLAKGALFLGVGIAAGAASRRAAALVVGGLVACSLALAGAPLLSGAVAKSAFERALAGTSWVWTAPILALTGAATTVLLGRFLLLAHAERGSTQPARAGMWAPWLALVAGTVAAAWFVPAAVDLPGVQAYAPSVAGALSATWPILLGLGLLAVALAAPSRALPSVEPGDIGIPIAAAAARVMTWARAGLASVTRSDRAVAAAATRVWLESGTRLSTLESRLVELAVAGAALLALGLAVAALLIGTGPRA